MTKLRYASLAIGKGAIRRKGKGSRRGNVKGKGFAAYNFEYHNINHCQQIILYMNVEYHTRSYTLQTATKNNNALCELEFHPPVTTIPYIQLKGKSHI